MKKRNLSLLAAGLLAAVFCSGFALGFRDHFIHHLRVAPGSNAARLVTTNIAEFVDQTGTNAFFVSTNTVNAGAAAQVGPRLALRLGSTNFYGVTNKTFTITNMGTVQTFQVRNGLIVEN